MSENMSLIKQRQCTDLSCENETYILDIYSYVQPSGHGQRESRKQLFLFITRAEEKNRSAFLQEEQTRLGLSKVHSDRFCCKKTEQTGNLDLITQLEMEDFKSTKKKVERRKINEMKWPEKVTYTLPFCNASTMGIVTKILDGAGRILLKTEQLNVKLSLIPQWETKRAVEHVHVTTEPTEHAPVAEETMLT